MQFWSSDFNTLGIFVSIVVFHYFPRNVLCCSQILMKPECSSALVKHIGNSFAHLRHEIKYQYKNEHQAIHTNLNEEKQKPQWVINETQFFNCSTEVRQFNQSEWKLSADGYLKVISANTVYPPGSFCLKTKIGLAFVCPHPENRTFVLKKCCKEDELLHRHSNTCMKKTKSIFRPNVDYPVQIVSEEIPKCPGGAKFQRYTSENCESSSSSAKTFKPYLLESSVENEYNCRFQLKPDGDIVYESSEGLFLRKTIWKKVLSHQQYCLDGTYEDLTASCERSDVDSTSNRDRCDNERIQEVLLLCDIVSVTNEDSNRSKSICLAIIWLSTCPLLLLAAVVNFLFVQKNVHGWTLTAYLISMFMVNIASVVLVLEEQSDGCRLIDFFMKFIYFSTLCWMTSINFSLWRTFRRASPKKTSPRRFIFYLIFCTVFPAFVVTLSYFMGKIKDSCHDPKKPVHCELYNHETLPFYSAPVIGMIFFNLVLFLRTTFKILGLRNETSAVLQNPNKDSLESFRLFTKLFLMTGSIWVIRVILLVLQVKGFYLTWYGVALEIIFSTPEAIFPIILIFHPEFAKWLGLNYPRLSKMIQRVIPCFRERRVDIGTVSFNNGTITPSA